MLKIKLLQRELFKEMTVTAAICLGGFLCLVLLGRLLQLRELFLSQGVGFLDLLKLFVYLSPFFLLLLLPVSSMMGVFLTLLRMGADRELISLRAGGISFWKLLTAPLLLCAISSGLTLWISLHGISWGMDRFRETVVQLAKHKTAVNVIPGVFNTVFPNLTIYAKQADPGSGELHDVFVLDATKPKAVATIVAPVGRIDSDTEAGQVFVQLENGHIYRDQKDELSVVSFGAYHLTLDMSQLLGGFNLSDKSPKEMSWKELQKLAKHPEKAKDTNFLRRVLIEIQKRFALPFACFVLGLFSIPLALFFQGLKRQFGLLVALGAFFLYYVMLSAGMTFAESGKLSPVVALWLPNVIFLCLSSGGLWMVAFEHDLSQLRLATIIGNLFRFRKARV